MQETWARFLGQEDPLETKMATHSSFLVWEIPWTEEPLVGYSPRGHKRVRPDLATKQQLTMLATHYPWRNRLTQGRSLRNPPFGFCRHTPVASQPPCKRKGFSNWGLQRAEILILLSKASIKLPASKITSKTLPLNSRIHPHINVQKQLKPKSGENQLRMWIISWTPSHPGSSSFQGAGAVRPAGEGWVGVPGSWYLFSQPQSHPGSQTAQSAIHWSLVCQEAQGWTPHQYHQAQGIWRAPGTSDFCQLIGFGEAADLLSAEWLLWTWTQACRSSLINLGGASWLVPLQTACLREAGWWPDNLLSERDAKLQNDLSRNSQRSLSLEGDFEVYKNTVWCSLG